jgi:hypothetical protein
MGVLGHEEGARLGRAIATSLRAMERRHASAARRVLAARLLVEHGVWEQKWEAATGVPWSEWQRRERLRPVKVLLSQRPWDTRVWIGGHEIHDVLGSLQVEQLASGSGELVLRIPLPLVEIL